MRTRLVGLLAVLLLLAPVAAHATWTDPLETGGANVTTRSLVPALSCNEAGTSAVISWTPPPGLPVTYQAEIVAPSYALTPSGNSVTISPTLLGGLLGGLLGVTVTVRVTATLPPVAPGGSTWTASSDWTLRYRLVLLIPTVQCS